MNLYNGIYDISGFHWEIMDMFEKKMIPCGNGQQFANWKSSCFKNGKSSNQMIYHTGSCLKSPEPLHIPVLANEGCYTTWLIGGLELIITTNALLYLACHHKSN